MSRDDEKTLGECLSSLSEVADRLVVVDTGSRDGTLEIAREHGAEIHRIKWADDFSSARNYALEQAKGDWVVFLDADEYLRADAAWLKKALAAETKDVLLCALYNLGIQENGPVYGGGVARIFKNDSRIRYRRPVHEYLFHAERELSCADYRREVGIFHSGYDQEKMKDKNKYGRNVSLLLKELKKDSADGEIHFYLADMHRLAGDWEKAMFHLEAALQYNSFRKETYLRFTHISKVMTMIESQKYANEEIMEAIEKGLAIFPSSIELKVCREVVMVKVGKRARKALEDVQDSLRLFEMDNTAWPLDDQMMPEVCRLLKKSVGEH
jgi:glycosyltransferase involved in cell wall biosynthesis